MTRRRRLLLGLAAVTTGYVAFREGVLKRPARLTFRDHPVFPAFRSTSAGDVTQRIDPLVGLGEGVSDERRALMEEIRRSPCDWLFTGTPGPGQTRIAYFTDYNCPICRTTSALLADRDGGAAQVTWHDYPILGPGSLAGARVAIAAANQGGYAPMHKRLIGTRVQPTDAYLRLLAEEQGLDADRLLRDAASARTSLQVEVSLALGSLLGFAGTPGIVIGDTVINGALTAGQLDRLIADARSRPAPCD